MPHQSFATTTQGLRRNTPPMVLFEKAKRLGVWNPSDIDFSQDKADWAALTDDERDVLKRLTAQFQAGEEAVTLDLLPLIHVIAEEGRIEEEMYLTTFLFEEAKHVDLFSRFFAEVVGETASLERYHDPNYRNLFYEMLPEALHALRSNPSPETLTRASTIYNMAIEGILAETGYYVYFSILDTRGILPGMRKGISLLKQDESRHIAYGVFLLSRLMAEDESLWNVVESTMGELLPIALSLISETFTHYDTPPFGMVESDFHDYAMRQFQKRLERIRKARGMTIDEVYSTTHTIIESDDA